eukprot:g19277.t1
MTHSSPWHPPACCRCRGIGSARALRLGGGRTGLPYFSVFRMNVEVAFGMIAGDDHPSQCYMRNFSSQTIVPPPGDPMKNPYTTPGAPGAQL